MKIFKIWMGVAALLLATQVNASEIKISDAWARATAPGQENGSVGVIITSAKDARLIAVSTKLAESSEIHTMIMDDGVMKMRQLEYLDLPANQAVKLGPGGEHLMLFGLKHALKAGNKVPLIITVQFPDKSTETINFNAAIRPLTAVNNKHHQ